jgi:hexulose-6-phosphate isomerase
MKSNFMARRDFLKTTAAAAFAASVIGNVSKAATEDAPKKAMQYGMLPKELSDADKFKLAKTCGFEGIEIPPMEVDAAKTLGEAAKAAGTPVHSVIYGGWDAPMSSDDPAIIEKGQKAIENALRCGKAAGADTVLLVPAVVNENTSYDGAYERSQKNIRKMLPLAEELKMTIAVENVWNNFLLSPLEFARYVDEFDNPWLRAYFDVGNVVVFGWPEQWIRILGKRIKKIHLKDFKKDTREWVNLRDGSVRWPEVRKALADVGYTGFMTPELHGSGDDAYFHDLSGRIDKILAGQ